MSSSSLAHSLYRRRIVEYKAAAYCSRLPFRARPPSRPRIGAGADTTSAHGIDSSIITIQTMKRWETLNHMAYKFGRLDKSDGKLTLKILSSIVERSAQRKRSPVSPHPPKWPTRRPPSPAIPRPAPPCWTRSARTSPASSTPSPPACSSSSSSSPSSPRPPPRRPSPPPSPPPPAAASPAGGDDIPIALVTALTFVVAVTAATFLLALLFYLRCTPCLRAYLGFSALAVLLVLGGQVALLLISRLRLPLDAVSFALLLPNAAGALALAALAPASVPIALHQAALVAIAVLTAFWFTLLPEWTTWALLVAMAIYDLAAVLLPGGPLRVLLELAIERNEEIPALVY
ncbi:presenilin-like protein [Panicum miliaceum]|uniref:Presenilin n=1 Tax=Panicum miliaceum TaxID=4540 RepID=A0A3L6S4T3_PANMI|nr:presenilin-like protein [Panicum miliaceum]